MARLPRQVSRQFRPTPHRLSQPWEGHMLWTNCMGLLIPPNYVGINLDFDRLSIRVRGWLSSLLHNLEESAVILEYWLTHERTPITLHTVSFIFGPIVSLHVFCLVSHHALSRYESAVVAVLFHDVTIFATGVRGAAGVTPKCWYEIHEPE